MFIDRYIAVPVNLYDTKEADMVGFNQSTKTDNVYMYVLPFEVSHYRPSANDDNELTETLIHMKNGDSFVASIHVDEFEKILNDHFEK